ncbi:hypothetical protein [Corynebacterium glyciniphilum]|uniref:hypothetical protein n=1 Tax=Corynebacterium glyciniphilum TaxID=1404244 RepID=UPI001D0EAFB7|nr:hypothetical protein [Corynebacterium glyciniphilum]
MSERPRIVAVAGMVVDHWQDKEVRFVEQVVEDAQGTGVRDRGAIVAELRSRIATIGDGGGDTTADLQEAEHVSRVPVPGWLSGVLVAGGLPRGAVTAVDDCPAALVDLLTTLTADGGCAAVVGYPRLALAAVAAGGGDLERLILVPDPTPHATAVVGTLVEGVDMVVYAAPSAVAPSVARPVEARLRRSRCALVVCAGVRSWPGARLHLSWSTEGVTGLGVGSGRVRGISVVGKAWGQGQPPQTFRGSVGADDAAVDLRQTQLLKEKVL